MSLMRPGSQHNSKLILKIVTWSGVCDYFRACHDCGNDGDGDGHGMKNDDCGDAH